MWVDASVEMKSAPYRGAPRLAASAIRYIDPSTNAWKELATLNNLPLGTSPVIEAEMIAIHEAFRVACKLHNDFGCLVIFSDSQSVMQGLKSKGLFSYLSTPCWLTNIFTYANQLYDFGIIAELQWVLAHSKIKGNDIFDKIARAVRISAQLILAKEEPNLALSHVSITPNTAGALRQA